VVGGCIYAYLQWDSIKPQNGDNSAYAEQSCVTAVRDRYATTTIKSYSVKKNSNGYVVRGSVTLAKGNTAKTYCLTNEHGTVREVSIDER